MLFSLRNTCQIDRTRFFAQTRKEKHKDENENCNLFCKKRKSDAKTGGLKF